ncbi:hypothetical protein U9M48_026908 [Paspalum notatum var. saurae]|uniref:Uncharacterized protein n=1 Tax=Paspalum notatum var. saurae TaxID=547442 RepID=A0AAQ3TVH3_PASNO
MSVFAKLKEEARKQLNSKHLHYEEMCSCHNKNCLFLLTDSVLKKSLHMALRTPDEQRKKRPLGYDDEDEQRVHDARKLKHDHGEGCCGSHLSEIAVVNMNNMLSQGSGVPSAEKNSSSMHAQIERHHLKIKSDMLKIEQNPFV